MSVAPFEFPANVGWMVVNQEPDQISFVTPGNPVSGVNITFLTAKGNSGVVFVDYATYRNIHMVFEALHAHATQVDRVSDLASNSFPR